MCVGRGWIHYRLLFRQDDTPNIRCYKSEIIRSKLSKHIAAQRILKSLRSSCKILRDKWFFQLNLDDVAQLSVAN